MAAAQRLGYTPNALGRNLVQRSTRTIGMVVTEISNPFYPNLIAPLHDELAELGYNMALFTESAVALLRHALRSRHRRRGADHEHAGRHGPSRVPPPRASVHLSHPRRRRHPRRRGHGRQRARRLADGGARRAVRSSTHRGHLRPGRHQHGTRPGARLPRRARRRGGRARRGGRRLRALHRRRGPRRHGIDPQGARPARPRSSASTTWSRSARSTPPTPPGCACRRTSRSPAGTICRWRRGRSSSSRRCGSRCTRWRAPPHGLTVERVEGARGPRTASRALRTGADTALDARPAARVTPRFAANVSMLFTELPFAERFDAAVGRPGSRASSSTGRTSRSRPGSRSC